MYHIISLISVKSFPIRTYFYLDFSLENQMFHSNGNIVLFFFVVPKEPEDRESHERSAGERGSKQADRRIDIQPAEDEDGL